MIRNSKYIFTMLHQLQQALRILAHCVSQAVRLEEYIFWYNAEWFGDILIRMCVCVCVLVYATLWGQCPHKNTKTWIFDIVWETACGE